VEISICVYRHIIEENEEEIKIMVYRHKIEKNEEEIKILVHRHKIVEKKEGIFEIRSTCIFKIVIKLICFSKIILTPHIF